MKILINNERADVLDFLHEHIINHGYKAGIAKNATEIIDMLSDEQYNVILTNGAYEALDTDQCSWLRSSSVFIIGITDQKKNESLALKVDMQLQRPFEASKLWQALTHAEKTLPI
jgi:DNA-binding response OmpR family regulator